MAGKISYKEYQALVEEQAQAMLDTLAFAATGNLDVEFDIPEGIDVLTDLAIGFSYLIDDLKELLVKQEKARVELEQRVTDRTQELERALIEVRSVQQRYVREQWQAYTTTDSFTNFAVAEDSWVPILAEAVGEKRVARYANGDSQPALAFPIRYGDEIIGVFGVSEEETGEWDEEDITAVEAVIEQVGLALENQRLFDQTQLALAETEALYQASAELSRSPTYNDLLMALRRHTFLGVETPHVSLNYFDRPWTTSQEPEWVTVLARYSEADSSNMPSRYDLTNLIAENNVFQRDLPTLIDDVANDPRLSEPLRQMLQYGFGAVSALFIPLVVSGQWVGFIYAAYYQQRPFAEAEMRRLMALAGQAAVVAQSIRLLEETQGLLESEQRQRRVADSLVQAAERMTGVLDEKELQLILLQEINSLVRPDQISLYEWLESESAFRLQRRMLAAANHAEDAYELDQLITADDRPDLWAVFRNNQPVLQAAKQTDDHYREHYCLPWLIDGQPAGIIEAYHTARFVAIRESDQRAAEDLVRQADLRILNARLFAQSQRRAEELTILNEMGRNLTVSRDVDDVVKNIYDYTNQLMETQNFYVALHDRDNNMVTFPLAREAGAEIELATRPFGRGATEYVIETGQPLRIEDGVAQWLQAHNMDATYAVAESWLGVPLRIGNEVLGAIAIRSARPFAYDVNHQNLLISISSQSAIAIQNARLFSQAERRAAELALLNQMGRDLTAVPDINHILQNIHSYTGQLMEAHNFYAAFHDESSHTIEFPFAVEKGKQVKWQSRPFGNGMTEYIIQTGKSLFLEDGVDAWLKSQGLDSIGAVAQSWMGVPLILGNETLGILAVQSSQPRVYEQTHFNLLTTISGQAAIAIQNARLFAQTEEQLIDLTTIQQTTSDLTAALNIDDAVTALLPHLIRAVQADEASIFFTDESHVHRAGVYPLVEHEPVAVSLPIASYPLIHEVIHTKQAVSFKTDDPRLPENAQTILKKAGIVSTVSTPLRSREGVMGIVVVNSKQARREFDSDDLSLLQTLADQATIAFERIRLLEEAERRARREQLLREITGRVRSSADVDTIMKTAVREIGQALGRETFIRLATE